MRKKQVQVDRPAYPSPAAIVALRLIEECPVNLECKVTQVVTVGDHDLFWAR